MNTDQHATPPAFPHASDKAITLALSLAQAEKAIHDFTEGQIAFGILQVRNLGQIEAKAENTET